MTYGFQSLTGQPMAFDTTNVRQYLSYFIRLGFLEFANDYEKKDSVLASTPAHIITVQDASGKKNSVRFFHKPGGHKYVPDSLRTDAPDHDVDNMFALINDGKDFVVVQYFVFGKVLQTPEYFTRKRLKE
jgi:hypothetical protein